MLRIDSRFCIPMRVSASPLPEVQPAPPPIIIPSHPQEPSPAQVPLPATFPPARRETCPTTPGGVPDCP